MNSGYSITNSHRIETEARKLGMIYPSEIKVLSTDDEGDLK